MKHIGEYLVQGLLGRGGMARVYKVQPPGAAAMAALKLLAPREELTALWGRDEIRRCFAEETHLMSALDHPNLVRVRGWGEHQGSPYYVMDYHCRSLALLLGEGPRLEDPTRVLDLDQAIDFMGQTLAGLGALHRAGLVHRDIKPGNLLLTPSGGLKISDFGLAKTREPGPATPSNLLVGSPYYTAPEQEKDPAAAGPASDLYSAGVVFLRMLSGRVELAAGERPSALHGDLNRLWDDFLAKALAADPHERFQSASQMLAALAELREDWSRRRSASCLEPPLTHAPVEEACPHRSTPAKVSAAPARRYFELDRFWRPAHVHQGGYEDLNDGVVSDAACGLVWQKGGSSDFLTWQEAGEYVAALNRQGFGGIGAWRLPSVDEITTLLRPPPRGREHCLDLVFSRGQDWVWTCDRCTYTSAWLASFSGGFIARLDFTCSAQVRAVATYP